MSNTFKKISSANGAILQCGRFKLKLARPLIMGILNVTPDSFSDGGCFVNYNTAYARAHQMIDEGADIIDIGGESTRPGAPLVTLDKELERVLFLIEKLLNAGVPISIDTYKPQVMRAALNVGVDFINDIRGLRQPGALDAVRDTFCGLCVVHMQGAPSTMQHKPQYHDISANVRDFLNERICSLEQAGIASNRLCVDPGFGFGKTAQHNFTLLRELPRAIPTGVPTLVGLSRKSMIGAATGRRVPKQRIAGSLAGMLAAIDRGAAIVRVHDVAPTVDALKVWQAINGRPWYHAQSMHVMSNNKL
ncbi:dihydropteroate synthase [Candidatus Vallotia lariciata]|uniref:dihydropteroate synthase n=1 Tax=Candidatus Vallotia laricis TaxID=2018052 RepID=UPI001D01D977|nr:dihydropteroate synthase [Candidatus Vallotia lariciata]UDG83159.1 Dihydropteroate synthase [Candidatus Vallotia lariciata]